MKRGWGRRLLALMACGLLMIGLTGAAALAEDGEVYAETIEAPVGEVTIELEEDVAGEAAFGAAFDAEGAAEELPEAPSEPDDGADGGFALSESEIVIGVGEKLALTASEGGAAFTTSAGKIATVSADGVVKGVKKGTAVVTATAMDGRTAACAVTVKAAPSSIALSAAKATLGIGQEKALSVKLKPAGCRNAVTFESSNPGVASVDATGVVTPIAPGKATITARTYNGKKAKCVVTVKAAPEAIALSAEHADLNLKGTLTLKAALSPAGALAQNAFESLDPSVASVSAKGKITAKGVGETQIVATTYNGLSAVCTVRVYRAPTKIALNRKTASLAMGEAIELAAALSPAGDDAVNPNVTWSSSNAKIAAVENGVVIAGARTGVATITAKTSNGKKATCKVTVLGQPKSIALSKANVTLWPGETEQLAVSFPKNTRARVTFTSSNPELVAVDENGLVTAIRENPLERIAAVITATTDNGKTAECAVAVAHGFTSVYTNADNGFSLYEGMWEYRPCYPTDRYMYHGNADELKYAIGDPSMLSIEEIGNDYILVRARKAGQTTLTLSAVNGFTQAIPVTIRALGTGVKFNLPSTLYSGYFYNLDGLISVVGGDGDSLEQIAGYTISTGKYGYLTSYRTPIYREQKTWGADYGDVCYYVTGGKNGSVKLTVYLLDGRKFSKTFKIVGKSVPKNVKTEEYLIKPYDYTTNVGYYFDPKEAFWWK